jgi:cytoplasmic iron level regulating protein YaaA (DUF328/UPF0246 family)
MSSHEIIIKEISSMSEQQLTEILHLIQSIKDVEKESLDNWYTLSTQDLNKAYGENDPEYTLDNIKELNPYYEGE